MHRAMWLAGALLAAGCTCPSSEVPPREPTAFETSVQRLATAVCERAVECRQTSTERLAHCIGDLASAWLPPGGASPGVELVLDVDACVERVKRGPCVQPELEGLPSFGAVVAMRCPEVRALPAAELGAPCAAHSPLRQCRGDRAGCVADGGCVGVCVDDQLGGPGQPAKRVAPFCVSPAVLAPDGGCIALLARGAPCDGDRFCESGVCEPVERRCAGEAPGAPCVLPQRCSIGSCVDGFCPLVAEVGAPCLEPNLTCVRGAVCAAERCVRVPLAGEVCDPLGFARCASGNPCEFFGRCARPFRSVAEGGECSFSIECALEPGFLFPPTCRNLVHPGDGGLQQGRCGIAQVGDKCLSDDHCPRESVCRGDVCRPVRVVASCADPSQCFVTGCDDAGCVASKLPTGSICFSEACASAADICGARAGGPMALCHLRPGVGDACDTSAQCQRSLRCDRTGHCVADGDDGTPCLTNGFCLDGGCNLGGFCDGRLSPATCP